VDSTLTLNYELGKAQTGESIAAVLFVLTAFNLFGTMPQNDFNRLSDPFSSGSFLKQELKGMLDYFPLYFTLN
jgi:hypothetical protein